MANSFGSNCSNISQKRFDKITSPGAQAEHDEIYLRKCGFVACPEDACSTMNTPIGGACLPAPVQIAPPSQCSAVPFTLDPCSVQIPYSGGQNQELFAPQLNAQFNDSDFAAFPSQEDAWQAHEAAMDFAAVQLRAAALQPPGAAMDSPCVHLLEGALQACELAMCARNWLPNPVNPQAFLRAHVADPSTNRSPRLCNTNERSATDENKTTLMLRNLPNDYTSDMVLELIDRGFKGRYDFFYLPMDFKRKAGLGYAFVNMVSHEDGVELMRALEGFKNWKKEGSSKICEVKWGDEEQQGREANIIKFRNSPVMHPTVPDEAKPMLFVDGERVDFPPPTIKLKPPRVRR